MKRERRRRDPRDGSLRPVPPRPAGLTLRRPRRPTAPPGRAIGESRAGPAPSPPPLCCPPKETPMSDTTAPPPPATPATTKPAERPLLDFPYPWRVAVVIGVIMVTLALLGVGLTSA